LTSLFDSCPSYWSETRYLLEDTPDKLSTSDAAVAMKADGDFCGAVFCQLLLRRQQLHHRHRARRRRRTAAHL